MCVSVHGFVGANRGVLGVFNSTGDGETTSGVASVGVLTI